LKLVGVDITKREDSEYFKRYVNSKNLGERIKVVWDTDQADARRLREIVETEFIEPLDLVFDDASHIYEPTKSTFETVFPFLRAGGLYIIEDWAWGHWKEFSGPGSPFGNANEPTKLVLELLEATGSASTESAGNLTALIPNVMVFQGFTVIERGNVDLPRNGDFKLDDYVSRRPGERTKASIIERIARRFQ
jgi:hypothetical protein